VGELEDFFEVCDRAGLKTMATVTGHTVAYTDGFRGLVRASIGVFVPFGLDDCHGLAGRVSS